MSSQTNFARAEVRQEAKRLTREGWVIVMKNPHASVTCGECGASVAGLPSTPGSSYWLVMMRRKLAKHVCEGSN